MAAKQSTFKRHLSTVFLITNQPQIQLIKFGTEKWVHILHTEGRFIFREAPSSCPGRRNTCLSNTNKWLLWFSDLANLQEFQKSLDTPLSKPGLGAIPPIERHLEYGLKPAETKLTNVSLRYYQL